MATCGLREEQDSSSSILCAPVVVSCNCSMVSGQLEGDIHAITDR